MSTTGFNRRLFVAVASLIGCSIFTCAAIETLHWAAAVLAAICLLFASWATATIQVAYEEAAALAPDAGRKE
jgi:hypothetical protein